MVGILTTDHEDQKFPFTFDQRDESTFYIRLAKTFGRIFDKVQKGGILVFLPSYVMLKKVQKEFKKNKLFKELMHDRTIYLENQKQEKNNDLLKGYREEVEKGGKAVFIAVCRGKLSEGIDFMDNAARCVIMAGIPYPQKFDPKVITKKDYLDKKHMHQKSEINGNSWYKL